MSVSISVCLLVYLLSLVLQNVTIKRKDPVKSKHCFTHCCSRQQTFTLFFFLNIIKLETSCESPSYILLKRCLSEKGARQRTKKTFKTSSS